MFYTCHYRTHAEIQRNVFVFCFFFPIFLLELFGICRWGADYYLQLAVLMFRSTGPSRLPTHSSTKVEMLDDDAESNVCAARDKLTVLDDIIRIHANGLIRRKTLGLSMISVGRVFGVGCCSSTVNRV